MSVPDSLYFSVYYVFVMSISVSTLCQGLSEDISLHLPKRLCFIISGAGPWWHVSGCGAGLWWHVSGCGGMCLVVVLVCGGMCLVVVVCVWL